MMLVDGDGRWMMMLMCYYVKGVMSPKDPFGWYVSLFKRLLWGLWRVVLFQSHRLLFSFLPFEIWGINNLFPNNLNPYFEIQILQRLSFTSASRAQSGHSRAGPVYYLLRVAVLASYLLGLFV
jgi:hypothetical protein